MPVDDQQALFKAIQEGDIAAVEQLLADDSSLMYAKNENGVSALMFAVYYRERKIVDLLLGQGIQTTIFEAAALGQSERVAALLDEDATLLDAFSDDGFAPLGLAAFFGHADTAALLLRNGADPDLPARNPMQVRPIHSAVANRDAQVGYKIARMLLEHGAEVNVAQHGGWTPLHQAAAARMKSLSFCCNMAQIGRRPATMARLRWIWRGKTAIRAQSRCWKAERGLLKGH
jgi:ankyrin repeat protein